MDATRETRLRTVVRRLFTVNVNQIENILQSGRSKENDLLMEVHYKKLKDQAAQLAIFDEKIKESILSSEDYEEENLEKEITGAEEYQNKYIYLLTRYEFMLKDDKVEKTQERKNIRMFNLSKIEMRKFDGSVKNWLVFWGQFKKIDQDQNIDEDDKIQYLLQAMETNTDVYSLVQSYPPNGTSYRHCIEELKRRYARQELLIEVYVRELLALVLKEKRDLVELYDRLNAHLRALETLGVSKYAAFILPLVESALPLEILRIWERTKNSNQAAECMDGPETLLPRLMGFLKAEVESAQRIQITQSTFQKEIDEIKEPSVACFIAGEKSLPNKSRTCIWCDKDNHSSVECFKLAKMTLEEREEHLKKKKACRICLRQGHYAKICKAFIRCHICSKRHTVAMCPGKTEPRKERENQYQEQPRDKGMTHTTTTNISSQGIQTLLQTVVVNIQSGDKTLPVRVLYDNGSQRSYIREEVMKKLGVKSVGQQTLSHCLFGNVSTQSKTHKVYNVNIESLDCTFNTEIEALGHPMICGHIPKANLNDNKLCNMLKRHDILLTDEVNSVYDIDLLIGADYAGLFMTSGIINLENGLVAIRTKLGWTLQGRQNGCSSDNIVTSMFCMSGESLTDFWSLETLGIRDPAEMKTKAENEVEAIEIFEKTVRREEDGRYLVQLPFKVGHEDILSNFEKASKTLDSTTKKLLVCDKFYEYNKVFQEWLELGIIEKVPPVDNNNTIHGHYLPHKAVIKESSLTSSVRPVFDASCPDKNGLSLNACLEKGMNFLDHINKLLIGFRKGAIGITSDIAKAFLQISLAVEDRNYLKFLWWEDESAKQVVQYRHCRVVFGLTSSPFLLSATLMHHLNSVTGRYHETAQLMKKSFYVDNCLTSLDSEDDVRRFIEEAKDIMKTGKFDLRMWVTSPLQINESGKETISVLGLNWNVGTDELSCNTAAMPPLSTLCKITKRLVLSLTQKIFDPIGMTCPVTLPPRLLLQEMWRRKLTWDEPLPQDLAKEFEKWYANIDYLKQCKVPRRMTADKLNECNQSLHLFTDASKHAIAACIFLRAEKDGKVTVQLLAAKSRVAPPKNVSIPRLELMAAVIGVRLLVDIRNSLQLPNCEEYYWTDSSVTLYWICNDLTWNVFVGNRVKEIRQNTKRRNWCHISGSLNWADLASRGCDAKQLLEQCWAEGPQFLRSSPADWPKSSITGRNGEAEKELKKTAKSIYNLNVTTNENFVERLQYFSKYSKIVRMVAWILRFAENCLKKKRNTDKNITNEEFEKAERKIIKCIQEENKDVIEQSSKNILTFYDKDNLLRLKTKLLLSDIPEDTKSPILVPAKNEVILKLVRQRHIQLQHAGTNMLITDIRKTFWVFGIRRLAKSVISNCMICKRYSTKQMQAPTAPLPIERIKSSGPFENTGVDLAGPLFLRNGEKCWIVMYTCAVYRAVHLELTSSLSTEAFIRTFRRFIARRGRVKIVISDNGTNFTGTKNLLDSINWDEVQKETCMERIKWKLNAPTGAWWGGFFERLIRTMKDLLRRVLGKASVTYDELQTLLCECESVMNNRPLTYVQDDKAESLEPLTPACFLQPLQSSGTADLDVIDGKSLNLRLRYLQKLRHDFRQRFRTEYLTQLIQRGKEKGKQEMVREGQLVLIEIEGKRVMWPLAIITKIFTGKDGIKRTAEVKTATGCKVRPIQRLYPMEMTIEDIEAIPDVHSGKNEDKGKSHESNNSSQKPLQERKEADCDADKVTRYGRKVNIPSRFRL